MLPERSGVAPNLAECVLEQGRCSRAKLQEYMKINSRKGDPLESVCFARHNDFDLKGAVEPKNR